MSRSSVGEQHLPAVSLWVCMLSACCRESDKAAKEAAKAMQKQEKRREKEENRASKGKQAIRYPVVHPTHCASMVLAVL